MKIDVVPDITMRGQADPHGRAAAPRRPTVGQLATGLRELAGRRADWWALIHFDPTGPSHVRLDPGAAGLTGAAGLWLTAWPPGHRAPGDHDAEVSMLVAGELIEVTIGQDGVTERPLRAGRTRVRRTGQAGDGAHELHNPGAAYAVTLHARPPRPGSAAGASGDSDEADHREPDQQGRDGDRDGDRAAGERAAAEPAGGGQEQQPGQQSGGVEPVPMPGGPVVRT
jgi:hypothetical protein